MTSEVISRRGTDSSFSGAETNKSRLILEARLLREQGQDSAAAANFAEAAQIEESLQKQCIVLGLPEKSWVHGFSAASCWAQAGDFYHAIALCETLLQTEELSERLRERISHYAEMLRIRRAEWYVSVAQELVEV